MGGDIRKEKEAEIKKRCTAGSSWMPAKKVSLGSSIGMQVNRAACIVS